MKLLSSATDKTAYENSYNKWLSSLSSEIFFWRRYMETKGLKWHANWEQKISPTKKFPLEKFIPTENIGGDCECIDIGCGPFPIGHNTDKVNLRFQTLDPLGHAYNLLKEQYNIDDGVSVGTGCVELLHELYPENTFDMVHMMNALDHSFNPFHGIQEMLFICKVGGKVILRHAENEAINQKYQGLHQWNLSVSNPENSFVVWRNDERHDVCKLFSDFADFEIYPAKQHEGKFTGNHTVVITKKKPTMIPSIGKFYSKIIHDCNYKFLIETLTSLNKG